ncbi:Hypothetical predicted protein [Octopus vulgaris]|uniref:Uncharacterized protein n=1 Tax=Octopus vulgaris TaxID=6645 RepID=A0AA36AN24_OCTVU|nr:Hypothetical predicted protein [Octopus vulgaris]
MLFEHYKQLIVGVEDRLCHTGSKYAKGPKVTGTKLTRSKLRYIVPSDLRNSEYMVSIMDTVNLATRIKALKGTTLQVNTLMILAEGIAASLVEELISVNSRRRTDNSYQSPHCLIAFSLKATQSFDSELIRKALERFKRET